MKRDITYYAPPGIGLNTMRGTLITGLILSGIYSLLFLPRYVDARSYLFQFNADRTEKIWIEGAVIEHFSTLVRGGLLWGFPLMAVVMLGFAIYHYSYHYQESHSIYLMRRLPNRWELHRRCLTLPVAAALLCLVAGALICGIYYGIYLIFTPAQCLPF